MFSTCGPEFSVTNVVILIIVCLGVLCCAKGVGVVCLGIVECREFGALANEFECEVLCCCALGAVNLCESDFAALG